MTLKVDRLTKQFEDVVATKDVTLQADDDDFLVLLGPSGSGKSTTLRCIAGLEDPTDGDILIDGERINDHDPSERDIAMVFQNYALYPHMTVEENMGLSLKVSGVPAEEVAEKVREAASILDIDDLLERKPSELSGGQQQRAALGRAIVRDPSAFLMDEPLSNLDAKLRMHMRKELELLHQELGTTFVYVTHDQVEAMTMGTKIAVLHQGKLQQIGTPEELYDEPANEFVAGFIGEPSMNFIDGRVSRKGQLSVDFGDFEYPLEGDVAETIREVGGEDIRMGIRPEHIEITQDGNFTGNINVVEPIGSDVILYLEIGDIELTVETSRGSDFKEQSNIQFDIPQDHVHFFVDGKTVV